MLHIDILWKENYQIVKRKKIYEQAHNVRLTWIKI